MISVECQIYDIFLWLSDFQFYIHARHLALSRAFPEKFKVDLMAPLKVRNTQYKDKCEYLITKKKMYNEDVTLTGVGGLNSSRVHGYMFLKICLWQLAMWGYQWHHYYYIIFSYLNAEI